MPGNHDHSLVREWTEAQGSQLARENAVPADATPLLAQLLRCVTATRVEVHYPGVWLTDEVWATHGHQLNHFLRPVASWGLHSRARSESATITATPAALEYLAEHPPPPHMRDGMPPERWLDRHLPARLAPATSRMLGRQMHSAMRCRHSGRLRGRWVSTPRLWCSGTCTGAVPARVMTRGAGPVPTAASGS